MCGDGGMSFMVRCGAVPFGIDPRTERCQTPEIALRFIGTHSSLSGYSIVVCAVTDTAKSYPGWSVNFHSVRQRTDAGAALRSTSDDEHRNDQCCVPSSGMQARISPPRCSSGLA